VGNERRIVGIALLRNEEYFAFWSLANAVAFCDDLIIVENQSTDRTLEKLEAFQKLHANVTIHRATDPNTSHRYIEGYAGQDVWVFGVDGDEIYDPEGLARLRARILAGEFQDQWVLSGYMLHAVEMDLEAGIARGYTNPHAPRGTKLHNFSALVSWREPERERLHGRSAVFRPGYSRKKVLDVFAEAPWERCDLRCLHLCFYPRSSEDPARAVDRKNPSEVRARGYRRIQNWVKNFLANPFSRDAGYKTRRYRRGPVVARGIAGFGRPTLWAEHDPQASEAEAVLSVRRE